jgi:K+-sensing histidine kinase KdpD
MSSDPKTAEPQPRELGIAMNRVIKSPLAALRASIESLAEDCRGAGDPREMVLRGALDQVLRLSRDVEALVEYAAPRPVAPLRCSVDEILHAALRHLPDGQRSRLKVVLPELTSHLMVDGPLLAACIGQVIESALASTSELDWVLLQVRRENDQTLFVLVDGASEVHFEWNEKGERASAQEVGLGLGFTVARRSLERMGGDLEIQRTQRGYTRVIASVPDVAPVRPQPPARNGTLNGSER